MHRLLFEFLDFLGGLLELPLDGGGEGVHFADLVGRVDFVLHDALVDFLVELAVVQEHVLDLPHFRDDETILLDEILDGHSSPQKPFVDRDRVVVEREGRLFEFRQFIIY